jgi:hypothetical protein
MRSALKEHGKLKKVGSFANYLRKLLENEGIREALTESLKKKIRK